MGERWYDMHCCDSGAGDPYDAVGVKWVIADCVDEKDFLHSCDPTAVNKEYRYIK